MKQREESKAKNKNLNFVGEVKELWNIRVMVIPKVVYALGTVSKGLEKRLQELEIRGRIETIQNTALLRSSRILRRILDS